jgi:hypothetical protein
VGHGKVLRGGRKIDIASRYRTPPWIRSLEFLSAGTLTNSPSYINRSPLAHESKPPASCSNESIA